MLKCDYLIEKGSGVDIFLLFFCFDFSLSVIGVTHKSIFTILSINHDFSLSVAEVTHKSIFAILSINTLKGFSSETLFFIPAFFYLDIHTRKTPQMRGFVFLKLSEFKTI